MQSQPSILLNIPPYGLVPITPPLWRCCSMQAEAAQMLEKVKAAFGTSIQLVDGLTEDFPVNLIYTDATTKVWVIKGTTKIDGQSFAINEFAGDLIDRSTKPNGAYDNDSDGRAPGGPTLKARDVGNGYVQLYWGK